jgi:DNA-binding response OmpR family regulator
MKTKKKILIVEDERSLRDALVDKLEKNNYQVESVKNGKEAYDLIQKESFNLIILDIILPKMDGFDFLKKVKTKLDKIGTPVIILTNLSDDDKVLKALEMGVNSYLIKSNWRLEDIVSKIDEVLK